MAAIDQQFNLEARFGSILRAEKALSGLAASTDRQMSAAERLGDSSKRMSAQMAAAYERWLGSAGSLEAAMESVGLAADQAAKRQEKLFGVAAAMARQTAAEETKAAEEKMEAQFRAYDAAVKAAEGEERAAQQAEKETARLIKRLGNMEQVTVKVESRAVRALKAFMNFGKASNPVDKLSSRLTRTVVTLFSVQRMLRYITEAMERAPDGIGNSFKALGSGVKDGFARIMVSAMGGMQGGVDRLNKAMNSKAGQTFFRGLEQAAHLAGNVIGKLLEKGVDLVEFLGNHAQEAFTVAAIAAGVFAAQMLVSAAASAAAALPLLLIVGTVALVVVGLNKLGVTSEQIFEKIGQGAGWLYALVYNIVADLYNVFAAFAEFFANVFNDPAAAVAHLFFDTFDVILSMVETAAKAIDALTGSKLAAGVSGFRSDLQSWVDRTFGENEIKIQRMDKISYLDTASAWGGKASGIAASFRLDSLGGLVSPDIKAIKSDTSALRKSVSMSKEDLKTLVDIAERRYINNINLTTLRPVINVNGANTGRTAADRSALADAIKEVLIEQTSSGSYVATAML